MSISLKCSFLDLLEASGNHAKSMLEALAFTGLPAFYLPLQTASLRSGFLGSHLPISLLEHLRDFSKVTKLVGRGLKWKVEGRR